MSKLMTTCLRGFCGDDFRAAAHTPPSRAMPEAAPATPRPRPRRCPEGDQCDPGDPRPRLTRRGRQAQAATKAKGEKGQGEEPKSDGKKAKGEASDRSKAMKKGQDAKNATPVRKEVKPSPRADGRTVKKAGLPRLFLLEPVTM